MSKVSQAEQQAFAIINSALSIVEKFPELENISTSANISVNPLEFLWNLLKDTAGYNTVLTIISKFISHQLPVVEYSVKAILLTQLKNLLSCSVNPMLTKEIILDGIVFSAREIDLYGMLQYSPFDPKMGKNYYFGCDDMTYFDELPYSEDMNALIWYMINKSNRRYIWKDKKNILENQIQHTEEEIDKNQDFIDNQEEMKADLDRELTNAKTKLTSIEAEITEREFDIESYKQQKDRLETQYKKGAITKEFYKEELEEANREIKFNSDEVKNLKDKKEQLENRIDEIPNEKAEIEEKAKKLDKKNEKLEKKKEKLGKKKEKIKPSEQGKKKKKSDGIITFEFNEKGSSACNAMGGSFYTQRPLTNCLHVFLGNALENFSGEDDTIGPKIIEYENKVTECEKEITDENMIIERLQEEYDRILEERDNIKEEDYEDKESYNSALVENFELLEEKAKEIEKHEQDRQTSSLAKDSYNEILQNYNNTYDRKYTDIKYNHYLRRSLLKFNIDYVFSLKLFDAKTLTTQLLDQIIGLANVDLSLSFQQMYIKNEIKKMITKVVETDDAVVSDCFFTFSNDTYDAMIRDAELQKAGLLSSDGDELSGVKIDAESILESINQINSETSKENIQTIINGALNEISAELTSYDEGDKKKLNLSARMNFIERLLDELAFVITSAVLSPKVYLIILIDLKLMGRQGVFNLQQFILYFQQLIVNIIRGIRDELIKFLMKELMKILNDLASSIALVMIKEQAEYYTALIKKLIECFKRHGKDIDWVMDDVNYADILPEDVEEEPTDAEC